MEEDNEKGMPTWLKILLAIFGIGIAYRLWKGQPLQALLFPISFFVLIGLALYVFVFSILPFFLPLIFVVLFGVIVGKLAIGLSKKNSSLPRLTEGQLDKIYTFAMEDLENGKISEGEFLRVVGRIREYRTEN